MWIHQNSVMCGLVRIRMWIFQKPHLYLEEVAFGFVRTLSRICQKEHVNWFIIVYGSLRCGIRIRQKLHVEMSKYVKDSYGFVEQCLNLYVDLHSD